MSMRSMCIHGHDKDVVGRASNGTCRVCRNVAQRRYEQTDRGRATQSRYDKSDNGRVHRDRYDNSAKGMIRRIRHEAKRRKG